MKTIAQVLLSLALSMVVTAGLNANVRGKIEQAARRVEATVAQVTDFAAQTVSNVTSNTNVQVSTDINAGASADSKNSASASVEANGGAGLSTALQDVFNHGLANAGASANAQGSVNTSNGGSFLDLIFGGQGSANGSLWSGK